MSYDLNVYSQKALTSGELRQLISDSGLTVKDGGGEIITVLRGKQAKYCLTLEHPKSIEPEDVPEGITAVLLGRGFLYEILVEGSSGTDIPHAVRFARRLAEASDGVVLDQQEDSVWCGGKKRAAPRVERGSVDVVRITWYVKPGISGCDVARTWLALAGQVLPEALPRRFGAHEPLSMRLDRDGSEAFVEMVSSARTNFKASAPLIEGHISAVSGRREYGSVSLIAHRAPFGDPRWREVLRLFFTRYALELDCVFASAEVERGLEWTGQSLWYGSRIDTCIGLERGDRWIGSRWVGLIPYPAWWTWFGRDYAPLVSSHLAAERTEVCGPGLLHAFPGEPQDRDRLAFILAEDQRRESPVRPLQTRTARQDDSELLPWFPGWLPAELLPAVDQVRLDQNRHKHPTATVFIPPLKLASVIPVELLSKD